MTDIDHAHRAGMAPDEFEAHPEEIQRMISEDRNRSQAEFYDIGPASIPESRVMIRIVLLTTVPVLLFMLMDVRSSGEASTTRFLAALALMLVISAWIWRRSGERDGGRDGWHNLD